MYAKDFHLLCVAQVGLPELSKYSLLPDFFKTLFKIIKITKLSNQKIQQIGVINADTSLSYCISRGSLKQTNKKTK